MQSPHDTLFHFTFRHAAHAASWLRSVLPPALRDAIDWSSLARADERLPGLRLRPHLADQVFVADAVGADVPALLVVEHKSYPDANLPAQLLRYAVLLRRVHQQQHGVEPLVLAIVLQHGVHKARPSPNLEHALAAWQPSLPFVVDDLSAGDDALAGRPDLTPLAELTLRCLVTLPNAAPDDVPRFFERWQHLLRAIDRAAPPLTPPLGPDAVDAVGWYALAVTEVPAESLSETFCRILHRPEDTIMSTLERTYQKGLAAGEAKGKAEGKADALLRMLHKRFAPLDPAIEARVLGAPIADLDLWTDRILDAATLADVLDGPRGN